MYYYNPWNLDYKQPFGAVKVGQAILLKFDANQTQVEVKCIIRRDFGKRYEFSMTKDSGGDFRLTIPFDEEPGLYFYHFEIVESSDLGETRRFYGCSGIGGEGLLYTDENDVKPYQLTVFEKEDQAPSWYREAVFYQIFPDRFYNGNENGVVQPDEDGQYCIRAKSEEESKTGSADVFLSFAGVTDEYQDINGEWQFSLTVNTEKYCVDSAYSTQKGQMICGSG